MILRDLEKRIDTALTKVIQDYAGWFPFQGKYLQAFRSFALANTERIRAEWERFHESGDVHRLIDFVIDLARGNLAVPWYLAPFAGPFLETLRSWLHANADAIREPVGTVV